jgi:hypothetical protein
VGFSVRATDPRFLDMVRPHLAVLRVEKAADHSSMMSASVAEDRVLPGGKRTRGVNNLYFGMLRIYRGPYLEEMTGRVLSVARDVITTGQDQFVRLRGGAVEVDGRAILLVSPDPEAHQATLTSLLTQRGGRFIGEGVLEFDPILGRLHPSPLPPLLYEGDLELFPGVPEQPVRRGKRDDPGREVMLPPRPASLEALGATRAEGPVPLGWIVFPTFDSGQDTELEPAGGAALLFRFAEAILNRHVWRDRSVILLRDLVERTAVSRLTVGPMAEAADLLMRTAPGLMKGVSA